LEVQAVGGTYYYVDTIIDDYDSFENTKNLLNYDVENHGEWVGKL
jgi:tRNA A37 N6-isopentenylltransferase MiaA